VWECEIDYLDYHIMCVRVDRERERERERMSKKLSVFCGDECSHKAIVEPAENFRSPRLPVRPNLPTRYQALQNDKKCTNSLFFSFSFLSFSLSVPLSHTHASTRSTSLSHCHCKKEFYLFTRLVINWSLNIYYFLK
jgi:hypothetical protein